MNGTQFVMIEGGDGTGKSTLAAVIAERYNAHVHHTGPPPGGDQDENTRWYRATLEGLCTYPRVVLDRFHWGGEVYGPMFRGQRDIKLQDFYQIESRLMFRGVLAILCEAPTYFVTHALKNKEKPTEFEDLARQAEVRDRFRDVYLMSDLNRLVVTPSDNQHVFSWIDHLNGWEAR